jgi:hypothetical protein
MRSNRHTVDCAEFVPVTATMRQHSTRIYPASNTRRELPGDYVDAPSGQVLLAAVLAAQLQLRFCSVTTARIA